MKTVTRNIRPHHDNRTTQQLADALISRHGEVLDHLHSVSRHPRSLARAEASWRPPSVHLPRIAGLSLTASITRYRIGPKAKARVCGYGETRTPAYLLSMRITDPVGADGHTDLAAAWIQALVGAHNVECVHVLGDGNACEFVWVVDSAGRPLRSPASLFSASTQAA